MPITPEQAAARVAGVLAIPLHRSLGVRLIDESRPSAGVEIDVFEIAHNNTGTLHGGLVPLLMDVACYLAVVEDLDEGTNAVTVNVAASLMASGPDGATVQFVGRVERQGRSLVFLSATASAGDRVLATGHVVKSVVPVR